MTLSGGAYFRQKGKNMIKNVKDYFFGDYTEASEELESNNPSEQTSQVDLEKLRNACAFAVSTDFRGHLTDLAFKGEENLLPGAKEFIALLLDNKAISVIKEEKQKEKLRVIRTFFNKEDPDEYVFSQKEVAEKNFTSYEVKICVVDSDYKVLREASKEVAEQYIKKHPLGSQPETSSEEGSGSK